MFESVKLFLQNVTEGDVVNVPLLHVCTCVRVRAAQLQVLYKVGGEGGIKKCVTYLDVVFGLKIDSFSRGLKQSHHVFFSYFC